MLNRHQITRRRALYSALLVVLVAALFGLYDHFIEDGNFSIYKENTLYRAGTFSHHEWKEQLQKHPFKTVINLRGESPDAEWYQREVAQSEEKGITFLSIPLSANHKPSMETMEMLVQAMRLAPKPLLVHCKQGADRTGLALALYAYAVEGQPAEIAARQLSIRYGHFPWLTSRTGAMDTAFAEYVAAHPQPQTGAANNL